MKTYRMIWSLSLLVIACISLVLVVVNSNGISLPDNLQRLMGVADMAAVVLLVFTSVKLRIWKKQ